jgi:hypothetical protein
MVGNLILKIALRRGHDPARDALFLTHGMGLTHTRDFQYGAPMAPADPACYGIGPDLTARIADWTRWWTELAEGLPRRYTPMHCREFDIQIYNREALAILRAIVPHVPDGTDVAYRAAKRQGARFRSEIIAHCRPRDDAPLPAYYGDDRDPDRFVRVMGDYCTSGLWDWTGAMMDPSDLPVTDALRARIADWVYRFLSVSDSWIPGYADNFARIRLHDGMLAQFADDGLAIARAIKAHLPDWTVVYHDENLACRTADRLVYQYEIT